jgi:hypothetical protein
MFGRYRLRFTQAQPLVTATLIPLLSLSSVSPLPLPVSLHLQILDIASGGWLTRSKRVLQKLRNSSPDLQQVIVTNRRAILLFPASHYLTSLFTATSLLLQPSCFFLIWRSSSNRVFFASVSS